MMLRTSEDEDDGEDDDGDDDGDGDGDEDEDEDESGGGGRVTEGRRRERGGKKRRDREAKGKKIRTRTPNTYPMSCADEARSVCRGVSVTAVSIWARTSLVRRRFSGRDWSGAPRRSCLIFVLMLSSDQSGRNASISRGFRPSTSHWRGAAEQRLALPSQRHDP